MVRILVFGLSNEVYGGVEIYIKSICLNSSKDRIQFDFVVKGKKEAFSEKEITNFYNGENHFFHIKKMKKNPMKCIKEMKEIYRRTYDAVYINTVTASDILYALFYRRGGVPKIVMHSHYAANSMLLSNTFFRKLASSKSNLKLACSQCAAMWMYGDKAVRCGQVKIINNGIDTYRFTYSSEKRSEIRSKYGLKEEDILIGQMGRLAYEKNQAFSLKVLKKMLEMDEKERNINLLLVGGGPDEEMLTCKSKKNRLENHVIMTGIIKNPEDYYSAFDVLLMPSHHEGLPIAGIEAQCEGLPCFFADTMDKQILITDRAQMIHLEENNEAEWAQMILKVCEAELTGRENYPEMIRFKGYDIKNVSARLEKMLTDIG